MTVPSVSAEIEAEAVKIAERRKCGAVVRENGFHRVTLCCDVDLTIDRYAPDRCPCLQEAVSAQAQDT